MATTKKELKHLKKEQEDRLNELRFGFMELEEYKILQEEIKNLFKKKSEIEHKWKKDNNDLIKACQEEIAEYDKMIKNKGELNPLNFSNYVRDAYNNFFLGTDVYYKRKLIWVSEDENFALLKMPSNTSYVDRVSGSKSSPSIWMLVDVNEFRGGWSRDEDGVILYQEGGRWSKNFENSILDKIQEYQTK